MIGYLSVRNRTQRLRRGLLAFVTAAAAFAGIGMGTVSFASPASASVSCYGDYCSGQDPMATGCANDAVTFSYATFAGGRLDLRWSPTCKTEWARLQIYPGGFAYVLSAVQDTGYTQSKQWAAGTPGPGTYWTNMIYSPVHKVQARVTAGCYGIFDCFINGQVTTAWV
jgi:hypothetical protein